MATLSKTFDLSKFQKSITKSIPNISTGFNDPDTWIDTGNYCLNKRISGDFNKGIPLGKVSIFYGTSGAGKSLLAASIVKNAQKQGIFCILLDTENALDEKWLSDIGVDTSPERMLKISVSMINDVAKILSDFYKTYKAEYMSLPKEERPKFLFVIDSLTMLLSDTEITQFEDGNIKGDKGIKAKQLKALLSNSVNTLGDLNIGLVCNSHAYSSGDIYSPDPIMSGGVASTYAASIMICMDKGKLKEDEDGIKTTEVNGIRSRIMVSKTRFAQPFVKIEIKIPYTTGIDPYSGLVEYFESINIIEKSGTKLYYKAKDGREFKEWRKDFGGEILNVIMKDWDENYDKLEGNIKEE